MSRNPYLLYVFLSNYLKHKAVSVVKALLIFFVTAAITALILRFVIPPHVIDQIGGVQAVNPNAELPYAQFETELIVEVLISLVVGVVVAALYVLSKHDVNN